MTGPAISVAMCTYNGARFVGEQLASFATQERLPHELVVCDDGSSDATLDIIEQFSRAAPFPVRVERNSETLGVTRNFSRAIGLCTGDVIALSDQDDVWFPQKLDRIAGVLGRNPDVGMVFSDAVAMDDEGLVLNYRLWDAVRFTPGERRAARRGDLFKVLLRHYVVTGATLAFRSSLRGLLLPIPAECLHDAWIGTLVAAVAKGVAIEEPLIGYRQHATQVSGGERVMDFAELVKRAKAQSPAALQLTAARFEAKGARLRGTRPAGERDDPSALLLAKAAHMRARARIRCAGPGRILPLLRELVTLGYHRYSLGWRAAASDLVFAGRNR